MPRFPPLRATSRPTRQSSGSRSCLLRWRHQRAWRLSSSGRSRAKAITSSRENVTDVRGLGLMLALELKTPEHAAKLVQAAFDRGLRLRAAGPRAVRIGPPLVLNPDEAATRLEIIASALD